MRISDWSSDVCSSDLDNAGSKDVHCRERSVAQGAGLLLAAGCRLARHERRLPPLGSDWHLSVAVLLPGQGGGQVARRADPATAFLRAGGTLLDEKGLGEGKSVAVRVKLGGRRRLKKTNNKIINK